MDSIVVYDLMRSTIEVVLYTSLPVMLVALSVGLIISLIQALTQIQEITLTFVPKIIAIMIALLLFLPYMCSHLQKFTLLLFNRITLLS